MKAIAETAWTWLVLALFALVLFGCASDPIVTVREVKVPVVQKCEFPNVEKPTWETKTVSPDDGRALIKGGRALMAEAKQRDAYIQQLEAAIEACKR